MVIASPVLSAFNRGVISPKALARVDLKRTLLSAEEQTNWIPSTLGSMMLRPGTEYVGATLNNAASLHIPFIFSNTDTAIIELTNTSMRVRVAEAVISRVAVSTTIANGDFSASTDWTDDDETGATSSIADGKLRLVGSGTAFAKRYQRVAVAVGDQAKEHALKIRVVFGTATLRIGSAQGTENLLAAVTLGEGYHSIAYNPTGHTYSFIELSNSSTTAALVSSCEIAASGDMVVTTPWATADLPYIRYEQSADVVYLASTSIISPYKIERRAARSWSVVKYAPMDGPFRPENTTGITLKPSGITGTQTLKASRPFFQAGHVGALFSIQSIGQNTQNTFVGNNEEGDYIRVTGADTARRRFTINISGTWTGNVTLQRSVADIGDWVDVVTYTSNQSDLAYDDGLLNQIIYYRLATGASGVASGSAVSALTYSSGSLRGVAKVVTVDNTTQVTCEVVKTLGGEAASASWSEGEWSLYRGYPTAVVLHEGRLCFFGKNKLFMSVADAYESFDPDVVGDAGYIDKTFGAGPLDTGAWLLSLSRLIAGSQGAEWVAKSSSLDEPLSPSNINLKTATTQGSANIAPVKVDSRGLFVQKSGSKVYQIAPSSGSLSEYESVDLTAFAPEIGLPLIVRMAVQRQPDTRIHCVRSDGKVAVLVSLPEEDVLCWVLYETDGLVEDAFVLPGVVEDKVYYVVNRTIGGATKRYLERFALESECQGGTLNKQLDCHAIYSGASTKTITGLSHLIGETVHSWAGGVYLGEFTVSGSGTITVGSNVTSAVTGLGYEAKYLSSKIVVDNTEMPDKKKIGNISFILYNTHYQGLKYGRSFEVDDAGEYTRLDPLPLVVSGEVIAANTIYDTLTTVPITFSGEFTTDSRVALLATAPLPCTILAAVIGMTLDGGT